MFKNVFSVAKLVESVSKLGIRNASSFMANKPARPLLAPIGQPPALQANLKGWLCASPQLGAPQGMQVRHNWGYKDRMMLKDIKRREMLRKFAPERVRLQALRANTLLPKVLKVSSDLSIYPYRSL